MPAWIGFGERGELPCLSRAGYETFMWLSRLIAGLFACLPVVAFAHPHVFVDANLTLRFDDRNRLGAAEIVWVYDEFSTMMILADLGLDPDGDGRLDAAETARLRQIARHWPEGFDGDLYLSRDGLPLVLSSPLERRLEYRDGRLIDIHLRALPIRPDPTDGAISIRMYDPGYYTVYQLSSPPRIVGREGCEIRVQRADSAAARRLYADQLALLDALVAMGQKTTSDIGVAFADELTLSCASRR